MNRSLTTHKNENEARVNMNLSVYLTIFCFEFARNRNIPVDNKKTYRQAYRTLQV